jgi:hypothetical protein
MSLDDTAVHPPVCFTIAEFCRLHRISPAFYFVLRKAGKGPREMRLGSRRVITVESAAVWRRERESA